ncbi:hypothetical protein ACFLX0_03070 [Chloroflexota bacterium]
MSKNIVLRVGLIGAGLQGGRRESALKQFPNIKLVIVANHHLDAAQRLADSMGCEATDRWVLRCLRKRLADSTPVQSVIVITIAGMVLISVGIITQIMRRKVY